MIEGVEFEELDETVRLVAHVRPTSRSASRCGRCGRRAACYDRGQGRRRWRGLDFGEVLVFLEADAPRVCCPEHGVVVAAVPWARHGAGHTRAFDQQVAWLATQCSKSAITDLMRIAWRTVGAIITRVWDETAAAADPFAGLTRIGIDEISYKRGHKYLTVVVDHDTGRLVWAAPGRDRATLGRFFDALTASGAGSGGGSGGGPGGGSGAGSGAGSSVHAGQEPGHDRCALITHVSADGADWIADVVARRCPNAVRCADPFHVVGWAGEALDAVRREAWNQARKAGHQTVRTSTSGRPRTASTGPAKAFKQARFVLWKNPENLTDHQRAKLAWIAKNDPRLHRAYLLKEGLRLVFQLPASEAPAALNRWINWARRCRIPSFVKLQQTICRHREAILAAIEHGLSNGRIESVNTKIRLLTRVAFGFKSPQSLIALAMLNLGGNRPALPGR